jgi:hypothetical protein
MNLDKLAVENQAATTTNQDAAGADQASEITPMALESYRLVGGGSGIVLLG